MTRLQMLAHAPAKRKSLRLIEHSKVSRSRLSTTARDSASASLRK
jgi:hypothetical protein